MTGKMRGVPAISTSVALNPICKQRAKDPNSICAKCFAAATVKRYGGLRENLKHNTSVLTQEVLPLDDLPQFTFAVNMVRLEAFGDLNNVIQVRNYFNICRKNPHVHFALWTKNPHLIAIAINDGFSKPDNLVIVYSSPLLNVPVITIFARYDFVDKVFTVYDKATIAEQNININCGAKSCASCGLCYFDKKVKYINEQLK